MTEIDHAPAILTAEPFRPQPDGSIDPAGEAGWFLQRERERRALSLEDIAAETGIHESHLDGIEHGDLTRLPSRLEALKMVGIYGQYLGFDPEPLIVHYAEFLPRPIAPAKTAGSRTPRPLSSATVISFTHVLRHGPLQRMSRTIGSCLAAMVVFSALWLLVPGTPREDITAAIDPLPTASVAPESELEASPSGDAKASTIETPMPDDQIELPSSSDRQARRDKRTRKPRCPYCPNDRRRRLSTSSRRRSSRLGNPRCPALADLLPANAESSRARQVAWPHRR